MSREKTGVMGRWRAARLQYHVAQQLRSQSLTTSTLPTLGQRAAALNWRVRRRQRQRVLARRRREDRAWQAARHPRREHLAQSPPVTAWIAILVITDNCSRQCLELPLFVAGAHGNRRDGHRSPVDPAATRAPVSDFQPRQPLYRAGVRPVCTGARVHPRPDCTTPAVSNGIAERFGGPSRYG
jgi:hypothetical protein